MTTAKQVVMTAIHIKGIERVKSESKELADNLLCSEAYVNQLIKKVEKAQIVIKGA